MSIIELAPCEYSLSPAGVQHLVSQNPEDYMTLCGVIIQKTWTISDETLSGVAATCLPCRLELNSRRANVQLGNYMATEGCDRCKCDSQHWANDHCMDCGAEWTPEARGEAAADD